jgi:hypothetical protein
VTQTKLNLGKKYPLAVDARELDSDVGLISDEQIVTLRFSQGRDWGRRTREFQISRETAEHLSRLLNDELDVREWL